MTPLTHHDSLQTGHHIQRADTSPYLLPHETNKDNIFKAQTQHALRNHSLYIEDAKY
jgi:hypothetical protein